MGLAYHAGRVGGSLPVVMNAANEVIVAEFLSGRAKFTDIEKTVARIMELHEQDGVIKTPSLDDIFAVDSWARQMAGKIHEEVLKDR